MRVDLFKPFLTGSFDHFIKLFVLIVKIHVKVMPEPDPAPKLLSSFPSDAVEAMMPVQVDAAPGDEANLLTLHDALHVLLPTFQSFFQPVRP